MQCVYCEKHIENSDYVSIGGEYFHGGCYTLYMEELDEAQPLDDGEPWQEDYDEADFDSGEDPYGYDDGYFDRYDDDPSPYDGNYSEM